MFKGLHLKNCFWSASKSTTRSKFEKWMEEIAKVDTNAYQYLNNIPSKYWSKHSFETKPKCDLALNNMSECFNSFILDARDRPIIQMCEMIRKKVTIRITKKFEAYSKIEKEIGVKIQKKLDKWKNVSRTYTPTWCGNMKFEVEGRNDQYSVEVDNKKCSCRRWDLTRIPCHHAVQCILYLKKRPEEFVDAYYSKESLVKTYSFFLEPVNGHNLWPKSNYDPIQPPMIRRPPGRPRRQRKRDVDEASSSQRFKRCGPTIRCSKCKRVGHNSRSCKGPVARRRKQTRGEMTFMGFTIPNMEGDSSQQPQLQE